MSARHFVLGYLFSVFVFVPIGWAQSSGWRGLGQIKGGTKVQVVEQSLKSTAGRFVSVSETDLILNVDNKQVVVSRDQIYRVSISGKNRKRNVLIGLAIGAGAGAGLGAAANRVVGDAAVVPGMAAVFAGVGAGVGALCPAAKTVYRAEQKQVSPKEQSDTDGLR